MKIQFLFPAVASYASAAANIHPMIYQSFSDYSRVSVIVHMREQADFTADPVYQSVSTREMLGLHVYSTLAETSERSQAPLLSQLSELAGVEAYRSYKIANVVAVDLSSLEALDFIASRDDIDLIEPNTPFEVPLERPADYSNDYNLVIQKDNEQMHGHDLEDETKTGDALEWNLNWINVPFAWNSSFKGEGTIYANADTGVLWEHESLRDNYYGLQQDGSVNHNYSWWDAVKKPLQPRSGPCKFNAQAPCDDNGHGTHTTSTTVGSHGVGVAPGAKWMACRNMDRGYGSSETYLGCLEFFIAPTDLEGKNPNPSIRPHAIGNSYGCPAVEGCARNAFSRAVRNLRKAGIFMSVSAGNEGPGCSSIDAPPGYEPAVISVGATLKNSPMITSFSSRGPAYPLKDGNSIRKPDVTAPGSQVRAAYIAKGFPDMPPSERLKRYATLSGTSMASPHVGGAALILTQACSCLSRNVDELQKALQDTAHHYTTGSAETKVPACGGDETDAVPNNVYGYGGIDLKPALEYCKKVCK